MLPTYPTGNFFRFRFNLLMTALAAIPSSKPASFKISAAIVSLSSCAALTTKVQNPQFAHYPSAANRSPRSDHPPNKARKYSTAYSLKTVGIPRPSDALAIDCKALRAIPAPPPSSPASGPQPPADRLFAFVIFPETDRTRSGNQNQSGFTGIYAV